MGKKQQQQQKRRVGGASVSSKGKARYLLSGTVWLIFTSGLKLGNLLSVQSKRLRFH